MFRILIGLLFVCLTACGGDTSTSTNTGPDMAVDAGAVPDGGVDTGIPDSSVGMAALMVDPDILDFGTAGIGARSQLDVVLRNTGDADLQVTGLSGLAPPYSVSRSLPIRIPGGAQRTLVVAFEPSEVGEFNQAVVVETDVDGVSGALTLNGRVESADGRLQTMELNFGIVLPGESTSDFAVVENLSTATLTITAIDGIMPPFSIPEGQLPAMGDSMAEARCLINFSPEEEGDYAQTVTVRTNAGDFMMSLVGRSLAPGAITLQAVGPAWSPTDEDSTLRIIGGPFPDEAPRILVGEIELINPQRVDQFVVTGTLPTDDAAPLGPQDVRVEFGPTFGLLTGKFIRTPPIAEGQSLNEADLTEPIGPDGNPWRFDTLRTEGAELTILPDTVLVADRDEVDLTMDAAVTIGGRDGLVVFSHRDRGGPGDRIRAWSGLRFQLNEARGSVLNTVVEHAGMGRAPVVVIESGFVAFEGLTVQAARAAASGINYLGGSVSLVGALFDNLENTAMNLASAESIAQLSGTVVTSGSPVVARAPLFGRLPIGPGHDWSRSEGGIRLTGSTGTTRLANQPAGVFYTNHGLEVEANANFTIPPTVPFRLSGDLSVLAMGTLTIPGGGALQTSGSQGQITIEEEGTLALSGTAEDRLVIGDDQSDWRGITVNGALTGGFLTVNGGELNLEADFGDIEGLTVTRAPLMIGGSGNLLGLTFQSDDDSIAITTGTGRLAGTVDSGAAVDVQFGDPELCDRWDLSGLRRVDNAPLATNCP